MSQLGSGSGTSFPGAIDTATTEVNAPAAGKTKARAEVVNDLLSAVVAIETAMTATTATATATASKIPIADGSGKLDTWISSASTTVAGISALPTWTTPTFSAGDFTASGSMTWTVEAGDVATYQYCILGKLMFLNFNIVTTTIGGTPAAELRIAIPASKVPAKNSTIVYSNYNNSVGTISQISLATSRAYLVLFKNPAGAAWTAETNTTEVYGQVFFEIQ